MKFIVKAVILLLIINGLLLYVHFSQVGSAVSNTTSASTYSQEIKVINRPDALYIDHQFNGLLDQRYEIEWPKESTERSCSESGATACSHFGEELTAFVEETRGSQSISYRIPKDKPMQDSFLFKSVFAGLQGANVENTIFHMTDETASGGLWVTGLKLIGQKKMDLIDYSFYRGLGKVTDLYWQKREQALSYDGDRLSVFGTFTDMEAVLEAEAMLEKIDAFHSTIVLGSDYSPEITTNRFIIAGSADAEKIADLSLTTNMFIRFSIPENQHGIAESIASILIGKGIGSEKSRVQFEELVNALTQDEYKLVTERIKTMSGEKMDASVLDNLLSDTTGFNVSFFTDNSQTENELYPFLFLDQREIHVNGKSSPDVKLIIKENKTFYPAEEVLTSSGYTIRSNDKSLYVESEKRRFRFPLRDSFYVYNERKFNVVSKPFDVIGGHYYFEEDWLIRLFLFDIEKKSETINIVPKTLF